MRKTRSSQMLAATAIAVAVGMSASILKAADPAVYSSLAGAQTTTVALAVNGANTFQNGRDAGIGDEYTTGFATLNLTDFSFNGGITNPATYNHLFIDFYTLAGIRVASLSPGDTEVSGNSLHTLDSLDFYQNGYPGPDGVTIPGSGYVIFSPQQYGNYNVSTGVYEIVPASAPPPSFTLGFGQAPTVGSNNPNISAETDTSRPPVLLPGKYASGVNQFAQFELNATGTAGWIAAGSGNWEDPNNWQDGVVPNGTNRFATFADSIGSGAVTVTLTSNEAVGIVTFAGTLGGSYTIASSTSSLSLVDYSSVDSIYYNAVISVNAGNQTINAPINFTQGLNVQTYPGSLTLGGPVTGSGVLSVITGSSMIVSPTGVIGVPLVTAGNVLFAPQLSGSTILNRPVPSISITSGGLVTVGATTSSVPRQVLVTGGLTLSGSTGNWTSKLDLSNNDAIVQGGTLSVLNNQVKQGYSGGTWQGSNGIVSSAAASSPSHLTALGVILNDNGTGSHTALYSTFDGAASGNSDVLIKYTYYGDANLDGKVDGSDYTRIDAAYNADRITPGALTGWFNGDFNYDGLVDGSDYTLIDNAFNMQGAQFASAIATSQIAPAFSSSAVPEPTALLMIATASLGLLDRRRRMTHSHG